MFIGKDTGAAVIGPGGCVGGGAGDLRGGPTLPLAREPSGSVPDSVTSSVLVSAREGRGG